jgi:hypothetical protein
MIGKFLKSVGIIVFKAFQFTFSCTPFGNDNSSSDVAAKSCLAIASIILLSAKN